ncbi:MAG: M23 family metallopeptidase [bacterium]|nr:M23 family metallopeptidase [bacterium]
MSLGALLLQPEKLTQAAVAEPESALLQDFFNLLLQFAGESTNGEEFLKILEETGKAAAARMTGHVGGKIDGGWIRLRDWLRPMVRTITDFINSFPDDEEPEKVVEFFVDTLSSLAQKMSALSVDQLRQPIAELLDIFQNDFGLNGGFIEQQVWALVDDLADRLEQGNRLQQAQSLRSIKKRLQARFTFPDFNADQLAADLANLLKQYGIDKLTEKIACYGGKGKDIFSALEAILQLVPSASFGAGSVGAAEAAPNTEYLWYASWLKGKKYGAGYYVLAYILSDILMLPLPTNEFYLDKDSNTLKRRNFFLNEDDLGAVSDNDVWKTAPLNTYSFKNKTAEEMEQAAYVSSLITDCCEFVLHALSIESGDWLSNLLFMGGDGLNFGLSLGKKCPVPALGQYFGRFGLYLLGGLLGIHTKADAGPGAMKWVTQWSVEAIESDLYHAMVHGVRNAALSIMTLDNNDTSAPDSAKSDNFKEIAGLVKLVNGLFIIPLVFSARAVKGKDNFGVRSLTDGNKIGATWGWWLGGGLCSTVLGVSVGTLIAQGISGEYNEDIWAEWGDQLWKSFFDPIVYFWIVYYLVEDGNTDDGKFNPTSATAFNGYPAHAASPYKLPFRRGQTVRCGQGNQGLMSHHHLVWSVVYSFDFDLDQGVEVLASRGGTVVDYFDWVPDNQNISVTVPPSPPIAKGGTFGTSFNFIVIRHDTNNAAHDLDQGGANTTTYATYAHGRHESVRQAFNARSTPVAPSNIIGTAVNQGDVIMKCGNTGISPYNHMHMEVRPGPAVPSTPPFGAAVRYWDLEHRTIPFVFRDAKHRDLYTIIRNGQDGVPRSMNWYTSDNG